MGRSMRTTTWTVALSMVIATGLLGTQARAVIIRGGDGTGNTTAPVDDPGWANVGTKAVGGATVVYLGNGWVLTANHVGAGDVIFGGITYAMVPGTWYRLQTPGSPPTNADLGMFRIAEQPPGLAALLISDTTPPASAEVVGIGYGRNRAQSETWWNSAWQEQTGTPAYYGFNWGTGSTKRWGSNHIDGTENVLDTQTFYTTFTRFGGAGDDEMQAALGDSGGAVFYKRGDQWELSGIILAIQQYTYPKPGQPFTTAVYGNRTYAADLSAYKDQIMTYYVVPEPGTLALALIGLAAAAIVGFARPRRT